MKKILLITTNDIKNVKLPSRTLSGFVDLGCRQFELDVAFLSLLGFYNTDFYPGRAYIEALGMGLSPQEQICASGIVASLSEDSFLDRRIMINRDSLELIAEMVDGVEIDGVHFSVTPAEGGLMILLKGDNLTERVSPNYSSSARGSVGQVIAFDEDSKKTASVLNRFITKTHRNLNSANLGIEPKPNIILIKSLGKSQSIVGLSPYKDKAVCISDSVVGRGVARFCRIVTESKVPDRISDIFKKQNIVWIDTRNEKIDISKLPEDVRIAVVSLGKEDFKMLTYPARVHLSGDFKMKKIIFEKNELLPWMIKS
ncbi:MAG: hypothetical protein JW716_04975 [Candidatus Aenigmarchaeota archaeon]|nr:hypothetical protein [Candidatus Aenigmarchaeota archaeon]